MHASSVCVYDSFLGLGRPDHAHYYVSLVPALVFSVVSIVIGATIAK